MSIVTYTIKKRIILKTHTNYKENDNEKEKENDNYESIK